MKRFIAILILNTLLLSLSAQDFKAFNGKIKLKNTSYGTTTSFLGKYGDQFLIASTNPSGITSKKYAIHQPAKLFLINKDGTVALSNDLKEQLESQKIKFNYNFGTFLFKDKIIWLYSTVSKEKNDIPTIYLSEIDPKTLKINLQKTIKISDEMSSSYFNYANTDVILRVAISDDTSKLAISLSRYWNSSLHENFHPKENYDLLKSYVFDNNLQLLQTNVLNVEPKQYFEKEYTSNVLKVNNRGDVVTLMTYEIKKVKAPNAVSSALHIHQLGQDKGILTDISLPKDVLLGDETKININNDKILITGMPTVLATNTYSSVIHHVIGYINLSFDYNGQVSSGQITPFNDFEASLPVLKGKDKNKQISFKSTILMNDGTYMMISQFHKSDIVVALYNQKDKLQWTQVIPRNFSGDSHLGTLHDKTTDEVYVFFNDSEVKFGNFFAKIDKYGTVSDKKLAYKDPFNYIGTEASSKEYLLYTDGKNIDLMYCIIALK